MDQPASLPYQLAEIYALHTNCCLFITGKAGTGKTTFLRHLRKTTKKSMVVVAPTGVAAINAGGMTIHSLFQLPLRTLAPTPASYSQMFAEQRLNQRKRDLLTHLEMLVIDEISMVRADVLDAIDAVLRHYRFRRNTPFGGVQVIMIGDLMQLSPVVHGDDSITMSHYYDGPYFFQSKVMQEVQPLFIELDHVFRQQNEQFVSLLNDVRNNSLTEHTRQLLETRYIPYFKNTDDQPFHITLTTHNHQADSLNARMLEQIDSSLYSFTALRDGIFPESSYPTDEILQLKQGARVMFIRNDDQPQRRFYNGKLGIITQLDKKHITVLSEGEEIQVSPMRWENIRYREDPQTGLISEESLGYFTQYPLRLAWAITIHKSQGLTFDNVIIDAANAFASGQVYVALSRCRTLEGVVLSSSLNNIQLRGDIQVTNYLQQPSIEQIRGMFANAKKDYQKQLFTDVFNLSPTLSQIELTERFVAKCVSFNSATFPFLDNLYKSVSQQIGVADKFREQLQHIILTSQDADDKTYLQQRLQAAADYFTPSLQQLTTLISTHPCKCKNKADATDFDQMISDLFLILNQKLAFMQAIAQQPTIDHLQDTKNAFVAPKMQNITCFEKPATKTKKEDNTTTPTIGNTIFMRLATARRKNKNQLNEKENEKKEKIASDVISFQLYQSGHSIKQIANERNLTQSTILKHLTKYIREGQIPLTDFVEQDIIDLVLRTQDEHPEFTTLREFRDLLGDQVPYEYLRLILL